jgi:uncharacterized protein (DUF58 family)
VTAPRAWRWRPTPALAVALAFSAAALWLAVALHRPDLFALGAPLLCAVAADALRVPRGSGRAALRARPAILREGQATDLELVADLDDTADLAIVRIQPGRRLEGGSSCVVALPRHGLTVRVASRAVRWGRTRSGSATIILCAGHGLFRLTVAASDAAVKIVPLREPFEAVDAVPHTSGVVGAHRSRRLGDGSDLATIRPFQPGDRLRRINWPVSQRTGTLHVTATHADQDAAVVIVIDSAVDVGSSDAAATGSNLDLAVHAAASVAEFYLRHGDRVGLIDTARPTRPVRPAAGRNHLERIVDHLLELSVTRSAREVELSRVISRMQNRALVILLSPLIAPARPELPAELARAGLHVLVVDTLGAEPPSYLAGESGELAYRMTLLRRQVDIDRLAEHGVPVVPWRGANSLDEVLRSVARAARTPRMRV